MSVRVLTEFLEIRNAKFLHIQIFFISKKWLTLKGLVAKKDCDNMIKPLLDAIEKYLGIEDHRYFTIKVFKKISQEKKYEKTKVIITPISKAILY